MKLFQRFLLLLFLFLKGSRNVPSCLHDIAVRTGRDNGKFIRCKIHMCKVDHPLCKGTDNISSIEINHRNRPPPPRACQDGFENRIKPYTIITLSDVVGN